MSATSPPPPTEELPSTIVVVDSSVSSKSESLASTPALEVATGPVAGTVLTKPVESPINASAPRPVAVPPLPSVTPATKPPLASIPKPAPSAPGTIRKTPVVAPPAPVPSAPVPSVVATTVTNKAKSKKKKTQPAVSMATASSAQGASGAPGENTGRWTAEEHRLFLQGLEQHGKGWKKIASLIKSRTVVQIRTHAQKYFQKLAKARQNGEEGDVAMDARGGPAAVPVGNLGSVAPGVAPTVKRRRPTSGTKRKAISSVVSSAQREGKKMQAAQISTGVPCPIPPLPVVAPALAPFVMPQSAAPASAQVQPSAPTTLPSSAHGSISGPALEDSLFRFVTPATVTTPPSEPVQVNDVARQAGANPIVVPADNPSAAPSIAGGEVSPTGVTDVAIFPSWTDAKDMASWYAKGADVDVLLDVADGLDWLTDTGDLHETYEAPAAAMAPKPHNDRALGVEPDGNEFMKAPSATSLNASSEGLGGEPSPSVTSLPALFESLESDSKKQKLTLGASESATGIDESLNVFDTPMEEHAFVSALLENNGESSNSLPNLQ